jgi:hypothetical protein
LWAAKIKGKGNGKIKGKGNGKIKGFTTGGTGEHGVNLFWAGPVPSLVRKVFLLYLFQFSTRSVLISGLGV